MKKVLTVLFITTTLLFLQSCGGGNKHGENHKFAGTFTDEFGDVFTLNDNMTCTIQFKGINKVFNETWFDGENHERPYATITYNGDPQYYYMRDGYMYRYRQDMDEGRCKIKITYKD